MDANRGDWYINGVHFKPGSKKDDVVGEFLGAVKSPNGRKVVSTLLNQRFFTDVHSILLKVPTSLMDIGKEEEEHVYAIKGGDMFVSKTQAEDGEDGPIIRGETWVEYKLDVSKDGKTAYLTQIVGERPIVAHAYDIENPRKIGSVTVAIMSTLDLTKDIPEVTNVTFAQSFTEKIDQ